MVKLKTQVLAGRQASRDMRQFFVFKKEKTKNNTYNNY
jgi:hypothetical protein